MIEAVQNLFQVFGVDAIANSGDVYGIVSIVFLLVAGLFQFGGTSKPEQIERSKDVAKLEEKEEEVGDKAQAEPTAEAIPDVAIVEKKVEVVPWSDRLRKGLSRSRTQVWGKIGGLFGNGGLTEEQLEEIEELLYTADIGPQTAMELTEALTEKSKEEGFGEEQFKKFLFEFLKQKLDPVQSEVDKDLYQFSKNNSEKTKVIMIVGVNGAGKTTTIGKLATKLTSQGAKVVVGACDTFRAAAVDQLQVWCDRAGATMIRAKEGSNPSGVGYDALQKAISEKADYCILDTAGRLHTKGNLMEELAKSKNVLKKLDESAPHHVLLVIDAITGQNAIRQAEEFHKTLNLSGLIFTKCDGSSKAGSAVSIVQGLKVPITYIGVGESVEDLNVFDLDEYLGALLDL